MTRTPYGPASAPALIVGQAPSRALSESGRPEQALIRADLRRLCGVDLATYYRLFARINVLEHYPGPRRGGRGDAFPMEQARAAAPAIIPHMAGRRVVLLGRSVELAFMLAPPSPWFEWEDFKVEGGAEPARIAVAPHPSPRSPWWHIPENKAAALDFWRSLVRELTP